MSQQNLCVALTPPPSPEKDNEEKVVDMVNIENDEKEMYDDHNEQRVQTGIVGEPDRLNPILAAPIRHLQHPVIAATSSTKTTSFSVADILDPEKFTGSRQRSRLSQSPSWQERPEKGSSLEKEQRLSDYGINNTETDDDNKDDGDDDEGHVIALSESG